MLCPPTKMHGLLSTELWYYFRAADMFSIALTECINRISSCNLASDNIHSLVSGRACKCSSLKWLSNACWLDVCGFPLELIHYSNPLIASLLELLQTNACAKTDWGEAGHTSVRCWSKSHPLPVWHSYLVNKENWFSMSPNTLSRIREVVKVKCNALQLHRFLCVHLLL